MFMLKSKFSTFFFLLCLLHKGQLPVNVGTFAETKIYYMAYQIFL